MGKADFVKTAFGLLLMMTGLATAGYLNGSSKTLAAVVFIIAGTGFVLWGETRRS